MMVRSKYIGLKQCFMGMFLLLAPSALFAQETLACIQIDKVNFQTVQQFTPAQTRAWSAPYEGKCIGLDAFNQIMEAVTKAYIDKGFITSRAYLPEQDLADGSLEIAVVEGKIEKVNFNGKPDPKWQRVVYPKLQGEVAQLRVIEQGLDTIRSMESYTADMELEAGSDTGQSVLNIKAASKRPWKLNYSANNYSEEPMGDYSATIDASYDHLLGINDRWSLSYTKSMSPTPLSFVYDGFGTHAIAGTVVLPFGKWENTFAYNWSDYYQETPGKFDPIPIDGWSEGYDLAFKRLMHRDQVSKTHLAFSLHRAESRNYIMDTLIESSSRVISSAKLSLSHERPIFEGKFSGKIVIEHGVKWFGAEDHDKQHEDQPNAQYRLLSMSGDWEREWKQKSGAIGYHATLSGQYSGDRLYGSQQFSIGGVSTVRGVNSAVASGSSGALLRQEVSYRFDNLAHKKFGTPQIYAGLDYGRVFEQSDIDVPFWEATGGVLGLRLKGGVFDLDIGYGKLLCKGCQGKLDQYQPSGEWMISLKSEF